MVQTVIIYSCVNDKLFSTLTRQQFKSILVVSCSPGTYYNGSSCHECPDGQYRSSVEQTQCTLCPQGEAPSTDKTKCICK